MGQARWNSGGKSVLDRATLRQIVDEAEEAGLSAPYHVYAHPAVYTEASVVFTKIPGILLPDEDSGNG